uniref:Uncharacterized protein n=1 Tax=Anopheles culicifacies TaxID=139723 RepID=A0A182MAX6_9DIPT
MLIASENDFAVDNDRLRKNTIRCDFSTLKRHLCGMELQNFVQHYLRVLPDELAFLQWNGIEHSLYLRLRDLDTAKRIVVMHDRRHKYPPGPHGARIPITLVDEPTEVLLFDLSELVSDEQILRRLQQYGVVLAIGHSQWRPGVPYAGTPSGQRLVRMVVRRRLPTTMYIGDELATVYCSSQHRVNNALRFRFMSNIIRGWRYIGRVVGALGP